MCVYLQRGGGGEKEVQLQPQLLLVHLQSKCAKKYTLWSWEQASKLDTPNKENINEKNAFEMTYLKGESLF